jgi:serine/threonine-protein kinase
MLNGTYLLERIIAEGGMGMVYEAQHLRLPRKVAVKVLGKPKDATLASTALQRFRREAEIAATLQHAHIVETFDFQVSDGGSPYLVMELLEGEDLNDRLKRTGKLPIVAALRIIEEMAQALDEAHAKGVVHRDLKPANVFLCRRGQRDDYVKVLDFGVSKLIDAETLTQEKAMVGTPLYMSPEQAVGTQELTPESDVFSFGAIAFEILTGRRAFAASSIPSILYQIVHGPTPTLSGKAPGLNVQVDEVFAKVLAKKKKDRFHCGTAFSQALRLALEKPTDARVDAWVGEAVDLAVAEDRGSGLIRGHLTGVAGETEVDSSTKAEEAMAAVAPLLQNTPSPRNVLANVPPPPSEAETGPLTTGALAASLRPKRRGAFTVVFLLLVAAGAAAGIAAFVARSPEPAPVVATPAPPAPRPVVTPLPKTTPAKEEAVDETSEPDRAIAFEPQVVQRHDDVQWTFHVVPKNAQVFLDEKQVKRERITMPWSQTRERKLRVVATGFQPITMTIKPTTSQTFELHLTRAERPVRPGRKTAPAATTTPARVHDAAPVQDL